MSVCAPPATIAICTRLAHRHRMRETLLGEELKNDDENI